MEYLTGTTSPSAQTFFTVVGLSEELDEDCTFGKQWLYSQEQNPWSVGKAGNRSYPRLQVINLLTAP